MEMSEIPEFKGSFVVENHGTPQPKQNAILVMPLVLASNKSLLLVSELYTTLVRDIRYIEKITIKLLGTNRMNLQAYKMF